MAVTLPPWLQIDPVEPARIRLQANAQRDAARARAQELQLRREQMASQEAAQERAEQRRERVLQQTQDFELAKMAQQVQLRREAQAQRAEQFQKTLRLKQQEAEREAKLAAQQMQGMKAVQKGLEAGQPLQKLISENAPFLFARHPERITSAVPKAVAGPSDLIARELTDESGQPLGVRVIPGAHGAIKPLPRTTMSPEGLLRADQLRLGVISRQLEEADPSTPEFARLTQARDAIMNRLEQITSRRGAAIPAPGVPPRAPAAAPAPSSFVPGATSASPVAAPSADVIRVKSPDGKTGVIPRTQLDAALEAGYEELTMAPEANEPAFEEEAEIPLPEEEQEE